LQPLEGIHFDITGEEYEYAFAREKAQRENTLKGALQTLGKEIQQKQESFEQERLQRRAELDGREEFLTNREKEIANLQAEVDTFTDRLQTAVQNAVAETRAGLTADFEKERALMASKFEGEKNVLRGQIKALERLVESPANPISELSRRYEQAYEKAQDIANRAVAAVKREVYSTPAQPRGPAAVRNETPDD
jgi:chromosome segregation ATPase